PPAHEGVAALKTRLEEAYAEGSGARLSRLLEDVQTRNDAALLERIERNIFSFWPQLVERLRAQLNADYIEIES
ncbi:hypothetical protein, partial [Salmonella enterica]|uniref:hypothetical protein n=1 Tax=Salmonella enterica TaxID=28901 RepID=UPI003297000A